MDAAYLAGSGYNSINELMRAMILRTVEDIRSQNEFADEAMDYMISDDEEYILSFVSICKHLGLDPKKTRHSILYAEHRISTRRRAA